MLKKIIVLALLVFLFVPLYAKSNEIYFKFQINSREEINKLTKIISIDNIKDNTVYAYANQKELFEFIQLGYSYTELPHPGKLRIPKMADNIDAMRNWDTYPTYETYVDLMYQFATDYPDICSVTCMGYSVEGREIIVAKITDNLDLAEDEPEFFYTGQMHGNELVTFIMLLRLIDYLTENYGTNDRVTNIVDNIELYINPLSNPDGTYAGGNNTVWDATRNNANSVDLNRNYPDPEDGPHPDGNEYQPETILMMDFADEHNLVLSSNLHSGAEVVNYPWDTWAQLSADDDWWQDVCHTYADTVHIHAPPDYMNLFNNGITNGYAWYTINGGRQDYMNYFHHCREMTLELSDVSLLPENELDAHWNYNRQSFLLYMEECLYGVRGLVTNSNGEPLRAKVTTLDHDIDNSEIYSDGEFGNYHRMLYPGVYDLEFHSYGYVPQIIENITVVDNNITFLDVILQNAIERTISGVVSSGITGQFIEGAELIFLETSLEPIFTNSSGEYTLSIFEGTYIVRISAEGYAMLETEIMIDENNLVFNFELYNTETESFETGNFSAFSWQFSGDADWTIDTSTAYDGVYSAKSGDIGHNEETVLFVGMETTFPATISFYYKVSSESGFDYLKFYMDDIFIQQWSGVVDWNFASFIVEPGNHTFKWAYEKDGGVIGGQDCAWVDQIVFPPTGVASVDYELPEVASELLGNYPNPFNPQTTIRFNLAEESNVKLNIYNLKGQLVITLVNKPLEIGAYSFDWNSVDKNKKPVSSGIYFYKLKTGSSSLSRKMLLLK